LGIYGTSESYKFFTKKPSPSLSYRLRWGLREGEVAGKLFEYLASGKPILSFAPQNGESEKIIKQANAGWVLNLKNQNEIKEKLKELYNLFLKDELKVEPNKPFIQGFERKNLTQKLSFVFEECLTKNK